MTSNIAQSYPYTTETEADRAAADRAGHRAVRRPGATRSRPRPSRSPTTSPTSPAGPIARGSSSVPSHISGRLHVAGLRARDATRCTRSATRAARRTCAERLQGERDGERRRGARTRPDHVQPVRQRRAALRVLHPLRRSAERRIQRRGLAAAARALRRRARRIGSTRRARTARSSRSCRDARCARSASRSALASAIVAGLALLGFFPVALVSGGRARAAADGPLPVGRRHLRGRADLGLSARPWPWGAVAGVVVGFLLRGLPTRHRPFGGPKLRHVLLAGVAVPLLEGVLMLIGPLLLLPQQRFNDVLDGATFGAASAVSFARRAAHRSVAAVVQRRPADRHGDPLTGAVQLLSLAVLQPVIAAGADRRGRGRVLAPLPRAGDGPARSGRGRRARSSRCSPAAVLLVAAGLAKALLPLIPANARSRRRRRAWRCCGCVGPSTSACSRSRARSMWSARSLPQLRPRDARAHLLRQLRRRASGAARRRQPKECRRRRNPVEPPQAAARPAGKGSRPPGGPSSRQPGAGSSHQPAAGPPPARRSQEHRRRRRSSRCSSGS